ncbi:MAG: protoporphyrinogen oxidase [Parachlamydiaceae bacterium]
MNRSITREKESTPLPDRVCVLGGGISGLAAAYQLQKKCSVTLLEKESRVGGWIRSESKEGFFFESGPRSLRSVDSTETLQLIEELGLKEQLIEAPRQAFKRYLLHNKKLEQLPDSFLSLFSSPLTRPYLTSFAKEPLFGSRKEEDESVYEFFSRHFSQGVAEQLIDPLTKGIFAANAKELSISSCFPKMKEIESVHRSLVLGALFGKKSKEKSALYTLKNGLEELPKALARSLGDSIRLSTPVRRVECSEHGVQVTCDSGIETFDRVVSTLPASALSSLLPDSSLKQLLKEIRSTSVAVVKVGYKKRVNRYEGFGYLAPSKEKSPLLGVVFDSSAFPFQNQNEVETRLSVMLEGEGKSVEEAKRLALEGLASDLGILESPDFIEVFFAKEAIPKYAIGHPGLVQRIEASLKDFPRLSLLGTYLYGVSVNQAIFHAMHLNPFQK